ncbi:MAG: PucR family transcriptional regulator ligand-binding domain-containing protein [Nocardioidaceae bacterium]|nr:PucR family transcriptional regulator ligand-binding domain-containing protein [Nocardioidaceae bacterium]
MLPGSSYGLSLRHAIGTGALDGTTVLAGAGGLDRLVTGVNVMEVPDVLGWVKPNELLLTTGFPLLRADHDLDEDALEALFRGLEDAGVAGFGIKLGRYVDDVPAALLALADELGFPVLRLPDEVAFDDALRDVYGELNTVQASVLERIDALHSALTLIVLEGGDLEDIAAEVGRVLDVGIAITSTDGREWAAALSDAERMALEEADVVDDTGRIRVERFRQAPVAVGEGELRLLHVAASGAELARLVVLASGRRLQPSDVHALERAATVAALLITRQQAVNAVEGKYRGDFLRDVFQSRAGSPEYVHEHAAGLGWDLGRSVVVLVAQLDPPEPGEDPVSGRVRRAWQDRFASAWRQVVESQDRTAPVADFSAEVVALLPTAGLSPEAVEARVATTVAAVRGDQGGGRRSFSAGVSRVVEGAGSLPEAYAHARKAVEVGRRMHGRGSATFFDSLGVRRLLSLIDDESELHGFVREVLGGLADDTAQAVDLRSTLQILLDTNVNVAEAARLQHFHYNTMRYRVAKLESLVGPFTSDPHVRLDVAVALQILQMA